MLVQESALKEIAGFSKKLVPIQQNLRHHIPEDRDLNVILVRNISLRMKVGKVISALTLSITS
jgi:hypothetical protein